MANKLAGYKAQGYTTVLLLETKDIALMNQHKMLEAAREGMGRAMLPGIAQIWYVEADGDVAIAYANVTNLVLARSVGKQKEGAVRASLGATGADLVWQSLIECAVLASGSGLLAWPRPS